ncbi:hypothetical protein [Paraconexibacter sp.]|uniref:hypothetical protein n=1 Tax=Paraconexibacter sp. TaxID=2949640 RepID=UPI003564BE0F
MDLDLTRSPLPTARRRRELAERRTRALGAAALLTTGAVIVVELARVWRKSGAAPTDAEEAVLAAERTIEQTVDVAVAGYKKGSTRENALFNMLVSFSIAFGLARWSTAHIRRTGRRFGPFRDLHVGGNHVHHFVPGIVLAFLAGGISVATANEKLDPFLAVPFGVGVALTLDETALLLKLDDVYWSEEGIVSVQVTFATLFMLSALALALRLLARGEAEVLSASSDPDRQVPWAP